MVEDDHTIADIEAADSWSHGCDHAGSLMSEDARRREQVVLDFFEIGVADSTAFHADQQFSRTDGGRGDRLNGDLAVARVDGRLHGGGSGDNLRIECRQ